MGVGSQGRGIGSIGRPAARSWGGLTMPRRGAVAATLDLIAMHLSIHRRHALAAATPDGHTLLLMSNGHALAAEWLKQLAGIDVLLVPYKGTPALLGALRGGEIDAAFGILGPWLPQISGGALRALAVSGSQRFADLPEVPTVAEAGGAALQRYDVSSWNALAAPARTPPEVLAQLNRAANEALAQPALQRQLRALGVRPQCGTPEQLRQWLASATRHWAEVVRGARIELQ